MKGKGMEEGMKREVDKYTMCDYRNLKKSNEKGQKIWYVCERKSGVGQGEVEEVWLQGQALRITTPLLHLSYPPPLFPPLASPPYFFASLLIPGVSLCSPPHAFSKVPELWPYSSSVLDWCAECSPLLGHL